MSEMSAFNAEIYPDSDVESEISPVCDAIIRGDHVELKWLIDNKHSVNACYHNETLYPIHEAVVRKQIKCLEVLIAVPSLKIDRKTRDRMGYAALHLAAVAESGSLEMCRLLIAAGASIRTTTRVGNETALHFVLGQQPVDKQALIELFLDDHTVTMVSGSQDLPHHLAIAKNDADSLVQLFDFQHRYGISFGGGRMTNLAKQVLEMGSWFCLRTVLRETAALDESSAYELLCPAVSRVNEMYCASAAAGSVDTGHCVNTGPIVDNEPDVTAGPGVESATANMGHDSSVDTWNLLVTVFRENDVPLCPLLTTDNYLQWLPLQNAMLADNAPLVSALCEHVDRHQVERFNAADSARRFRQCESPLNWAVICEKMHYLDQLLQLGFRTDIYLRREDTPIVCKTNPLICYELCGFLSAVILKTKPTTMMTNLVERIVDSGALVNVIHPKEMPPVVALLLRCGWDASVWSVLELLAQRGANFNHISCHSSYHCSDFIVFAVAKGEHLAPYSLLRIAMASGVPANAGSTVASGITLGDGDSASASGNNHIPANDRAALFLFAVRRLIERSSSPFAEAFHERECDLLETVRSMSGYATLSLNMRNRRAKNVLSMLYVLLETHDVHNRDAQFLLAHTSDIFRNEWAATFVAAKKSLGAACTMPEATAEFRRVLGRQNSLLRLCRKRILYALQASNPADLNIVGEIERLHLPVVLKRFLCFQRAMNNS